MPFCMNKKGTVGLDPGVFASLSSHLFSITISLKCESENVGPFSLCVKRIMYFEGFFQTDCHTHISECFIFYFNLLHLLFLNLLI